MTTETATKERPILFSGAMVRAILDGMKTQTRRVIKPQPAVFAGTWYQRLPGDLFHDPERPYDWHFESPSGKINHVASLSCPYGQPGDLLWVRETFMVEHFPSNGSRLVHYRADNTAAGTGWTAARMWKPSIHMPRWTSRLTLEITDVRVERVQEISEADCCAEMGCPVQWDGEGLEPYKRNLRNAFAHLWDGINAKRGYGWHANPWVWVVAFKRVQP